MSGSLETRPKQEIERVITLLDQIRNETGDVRGIPSGPIPVPGHLRGHKSYRHKPYEVQKKLRER